MRGRRESLKWLGAAVAVVQIVLALLVANTYLAAHNTLYNNDNWTSTKTTLAGGIIGAQSFIFGRQGLAKNRLNPSAWFGYQEVVSNERFDPRSIEFDFSLARDSHLTFEFNRGDRGYTGVRLSATDRFPPALLQATNEGEFLRKRAFRQLRRARPERIHRLRVEFDADRDGAFTVLLNDQKLKTLRAEPIRPMRIGFHGGSRQVLVDNVRIVDRDGDVFVDDFERPSYWLAAYSISVGALLFGSAGLFVLLRRVLPVSDKNLLFSFLMMSGVMLVSVGLFAALVWRQSEFYPDRSTELERRQEAYADAGTGRMIERIERDYRRAPEPGVQRLLFLGSSQMRGSGASEASHTLDRETERLLNERAGARRFECLNVAVRAYTMARMRADFEERWIHWSPTLAIVNAGYNDRVTQTKDWNRELWELIAAARSAGIRLVFIPEASALEPPSRNLLRIHAATRQIAQRADVPLIEMHSHLQERADDGFLWWDWVHLTSFGQRAFAEVLVDELERLGLVSL